MEIDQKLCSLLLMYCIFSYTEQFGFLVPLENSFFVIYVTVGLFSKGRALRKEAT